MCESSNSSDEMASFEVLHNHNGTPVSLDSAEFSLIPDQPPVEGEVLGNSSFNVSNMQSVFLSNTQDLSVQEIQERVLELVKDNAAMKEALKWNNVMMKEQLSTISSWHNQMTTTMSQQQLNLKEANDKVEELEKENVKLQEEIKELKSQSQIANNSAISKEEENKETATLQLKEANIIIAELQQKVDEENMELTTLKRNLKEKEESSNEFQREQETLKKRCSDLEEEVENTKKIIHESNCKISELETAIKLEQNGFEIERIKHAETKELLDNTLPAYERMKKLIEVQSKDQREKDQDIENEREKEHKEHLEQIDNLTAQLFDFEEKLLEREEKVKELMELVDALKRESESLPILKEQQSATLSSNVGPYVKRPLIRLPSKVKFLNITGHLQKVPKVELYKSELQIAQSDALFCTNCNKGGTSSMDSRSRGKKLSDETTLTFKSRKKVPERATYQEPVIVTQCPVCYEAFENALTCEAHANKCLDKKGTK